jgi:hypothetical protein
MLIRWHYVGFGLSAATDASILKSTSSSDYSVIFGIVSRAESGFRLDMLGSLGWRSYSAWGASEYGTDGTFKGASASSPYAGARLRLLNVFANQRRVHFVIGGQAGFDFDLKKTQRVNYDETGLRELLAIGGQRVMIGLVVGVIFDIGIAHN